MPGERRQIYGRRLGPRLRPGRRRLLEERLPEVELGLPAEPGRRIDVDRLFPDGGPRPPFRLEIGFGGGEHLAGQAAAHPGVGFIGCEPYIGGVARLLALAEERRLDNIRVVVDDARLLLRALPDACLERVFVLFPDPWPKRRHRKRRLISPATAAEIARLLAPGGELRLATDDMDYARAILAACRGEPRLRWLARRPRDWRERPPDAPPTRYEAKALAAGRPRVYLRFARRPAAPGSTEFVENP
ncbi:MAG TPA: tRNA (guanine(46)-N(7))-methyltransferase TrmB [Geminicoccaceae bacterium]|nr:tRNA (guanine(46)-N(7))-methyltransferase TrmB [Geminicoccaceae bacterium]